MANKNKNTSHKTSSSTKKKTITPEKKIFPTKWIILIGVVVVVIIVAAILINNRGQAGETLPLTINATQAAERFENGAFLLDVREQSEWEAGHISGAVLIPLGQLQSRISEIPADQDVLIICRSGNRSAQARDILRSAGLTRTTSITGGIDAWTQAGLPVITGP